MIYLDNSATTKPCAEAVAAMTDALTRCWGNPSSVHGFGMDAEHMMKDAREAVAAKLGAEPDRIFFTAGGTEADNWAIFSAVERLGKRGKHIITTAVEHHAVLHPFKKLELQGYDVTYLQPDETGVVSVDTLKSALRKDTILVSVMMVNNETGAIMPIREMIRAARRLSPLALFHTDAVQGFLKVPFQAKTLGADMLSISSHKIHGPKGCGALYIRKGLTLPPYLHGGGQEQNYRSGTEATPAIAGFGAACRAADPAADIAKMCRVRDYGRTVLQQVPGLVLIGSQEAPHVISLSLPGLRSQGIINCLQDRDIYVSAGSACSRGHRSHVLEALGLPAPVIDGSIRVSLSAENTEADMDALRDALLYAQSVLKG